MNGLAVGAHLALRGVFHLQLNSLRPRQLAEVLDRLLQQLARVTG